GARVDPADAREHHALSGSGFGETSYGNHETGYLNAEPQRRKDDLIFGNDHRVFVLIFSSCLFGLIVSSWFFVFFSLFYLRGLRFVNPYQLHKLVPLRLIWRDDALGAEV